jgi:hypothetical protein
MADKIFESISGSFGKSLAIGTLLPVLFGIFCYHYWIVPLLPPAITTLPTFERLEPEARLLAYVLTVLGSAAVLYLLNPKILDLYQGYPWRESGLGKRQIRILTEERNDIANKRNATRSLIDALAAINDMSDKVHTDLLQRLAEVRSRRDKAINEYLPASPGQILPTRLGNVVRCTENYARTRYGISTVTMCPDCAP